MITARVKDPDLLPYGVFVAERDSVIYDRKYRPIVRVPGQWPDCDSACATVVDPTEWITHDRKEWFYDDGTVPRRNKATRERLQGIVDSIPTLANEIERRDKIADLAEKKERNAAFKNYRIAQLSPASQTKLKEWSDKREARRLKRLDRFFELDDAGYAKWLAQGRPWSDAKKIERWSERRFREHLEQAMPIVPFPAPVRAAPPRYLFETISDLRKLPAAKWLVDKWIPEEGVGLIFGEYAGGKSFILFDLLLHLAYGLSDWHGAKLPGEPRDVLLIAREGSKGFGERIDAFKAHHGISADPDRLVFMRSPTNLGDPAQFEELKAAIAASGRQFKVVAVDTVGRALPGEDFYDAKSITGFMERLQQLGEIGQGVAIGVHHVNKSGDAFGSVYFGASSDFMFLVEREGDGQLVRGKITCAKMKDGEDGWKRRVDYGKAASSLVVASVTEGGDMMGKALKLSDDDRLALQALGEALKAKGQLRPEFPGRSVTLNEWLDQCFKIGGVSPVAAKPMRDLHRRQVKLLTNRMILVQDQLVRIIDQTANAHAAIPMATPAGQFPPIPPRQT
ncbi:AAA family ATPase [Bradyrhizobium frederickii]|uniref:AAA family ATPase n=1 Tax=Bradyrhizobium frederickii TaxID=2560054 RepID=A0A4Y9NNF6_9BRAD|nr:AAA family ATPase [Bradyrhizobium frederickii]TFV69420.1 AAA family ATPase [Bradyrhizobium frederickii]